MKGIFPWLLGMAFVGSLAACAALPKKEGAAGGGSNQRLRAIGNGLCEDTRRGSFWIDLPGMVFSSWEEATVFAGQLEAGGFGDWRLPTRDELHTLHGIFHRQQNGDCEMPQPRRGLWNGADPQDASCGYYEMEYLCDPEYRYVTTPGRGAVRLIRP